MREADALLEDELEELNEAIVLGQSIASAMQDSKSPLNYLVARARNAALEAGTRLLRADLSTPDGVEAARQLQAEYLRFDAIMTWIVDAGDRADQALQSRENVDGFDEEEQLRKRARHERIDELPDA